MAAEIARMITKEDRDISQRIKSIYEMKKRDLELTQEKIKKLTGWSQSYISHCMTERVALSMPNLLIWSNVLQVDVIKLDPKFYKRFPQARREPIPILDSQTTKEVGKTERVLKTQAYVFKLASTFDVLMPQGTLVHFDPSKKPKPGDIVVVRIFNSDHVTFGYLHQIQKTQIKVKISTDEMLSIPFKDLEYFHPAFRLDLP